MLGPAAGVGARPAKKLVNTPSNHRLVDLGVFPHKDEDKGDYKVAQWAVERLADKPKEPFFLSVGFFLPHVPCYTTQKWYDLYPDDDSVLPPIMRGDRDDTPRFSWYMHWKLPECRLKFLEEENEWRNICRSYMACTSFVDSKVGRVLSALKANGFADNTVIVWSTDNGGQNGAGGNVRVAMRLLDFVRSRLANQKALCASQNWPLRGNKATCCKPPRYCWHPRN